MPPLTPATRYTLTVLLAVGALVACQAQDAPPAQDASPVDEAAASAARSVIPFDYIDHIFIPVEIGESTTAMLIYDPVRDVYLDSRFVRAQGLRAYGGEEVGHGGPVRVGGAGGAQHVVTFVRDLSVRFGDLSRHFQLTPVIPLDSMMAGSLGRTADGLFGSNLLQEYVVEMDFDASRFVLHDPATFAIPDGATVVPIRWTERARRPTVTVTVHLADGTTAEGRFVLDFGMGGTFRAATGFTNEQRLTERIGPGITSGSETGLGGSLESVLVRPSALSVGALRVDRPVLSLARETAGADAFPGSHDGLIGLGFLDRYRVFYDAPGDRLVLVATERAEAPFSYVVTGLRLEPFGGPDTWPIVAAVTPDSPAAAAGLRAGDIVVQARGDDTRGWTRREWSAMLDAGPPGPIDLRIRRSDETRSLTLDPSYPLG
jgi:hypothetical protein